MRSLSLGNYIERAALWGQQWSIVVPWKGVALIRDVIIFVKSSFTCYRYLDVNSNSEYLSIYLIAVKFLLV